MKITKITVWQMDLPLTKPYSYSGGRLLVEKLDSTFIKIETDGGIIGWGEGCPWGHNYLPAHGDGIRAAANLLAPALLGQDPRALREINRIMDLTLPGHLYAKSPIDMACWDILGHFSGMPLWQLMGADKPHPVPLNSSIPTNNVEEMLGDIKAASAKGYRTHSVKIGGDDPQRDIERMNGISAGLPMGEKVTFDVNRAWKPAQAVQILNSVSARDWVEQPCETLAECAHIAARVPQPIMLDECLHSFDDHLQAWRLNANEGAKIKPNRLGGLSKTLQIMDFGVSVGWQMHVEDLGGSALADTAAIHIASATPSQNRLASWLCHYHLKTEPVPSHQGARNGTGELAGFAVPPSTPGIGVVPDENMLGDVFATYE